MALMDAASAGNQPSCTLRPKNIKASWLASLLDSVITEALSSFNYTANR
jgi:hypothetical protein